MRLTFAELSEYTQQIEKSDLTPEMKQQALEGIAAIERNDGDLESAVNDIMSSLPDIQKIKLLRWEDIVHDFPEVANDKHLEEECFAKLLAFCKENDSNPHEKISWSAYVNQNNPRTAEKLSSNPEIWQIKTVE